MQNYYVSLKYQKLKNPQTTNNSNQDSGIKIENFNDSVKASKNALSTLIFMLWNRIRQTIYALLTAISFAWTNYYLVQFTIATKGELTLANFLNFDLDLFIKQVYANPASSFIGIDVTIAALCAIILIVTEGRRLKMKWWGLYIIAIFLISFAFGFPLFLFMRERKQIKLLDLAKDTQEENIFTKVNH